MEQAIVIGAHQFIGVHLVNHLLEQGEKVISVDCENKSKKDFVDELELSIGRNANYSFLELEKLKELEISNQTTIYVDWYDIQKGSKNSPLYEKAIQFRTVLQNWGERPYGKAPVVLVFCPLMTKTETNESLDDWKRISQERMVYMPTIYGPWQPGNMSFAAALNHADNKELKRVIQSEYQGDAIYIDDFIKVLPELLKRNEQSMIIESSLENQWVACANELFSAELIETLIPPDNRVNSDIAVYKVKNTITPKQGITLQTEHYNKILRLDEGKLN